ncbi:DUF3192 domain-containing protein [Thalassotalea sp. PP2-459]|uniref:DUF3192 domain-containing protein n=1 Tax=Thalassotalea sp. PP2-459 TaxID=1742724 RepID=UPI000945C3F3|nr:DUF3192 domain-containing protein [Thalassotalea sp. PP2-459]OKY26311.1 hypothetical protein BI291_12045 [Thalassotalea sp. PP2-459]
MNKKIIFRIFLALAAYGVFVLLVVNFYDDSPANMQWEDREAYNRQFISKLRLGEFTFEQAIEKLGSPDITEAKKANDQNFQVLFYRTQHVKSDGITTQDECSYLVFVDNKLMEIAKADRYKGLDNVINEYGTPLDELSELSFPNTN